MNGIKLSFITALIPLAIACTNQKQENIFSKEPFVLITDSIQKFPGNIKLLMRRAELLSQRNLHELAYSDYKAAWENEQSEETGLALVSNLYLVNKPREAVTVLELAVKKFPANPEFRRRLSEAYIQTGLSKKAMEQYDSMLKTDSMNFETWYEKGMLLTQLKDTPSAIRAFERSYSLQPLSLNGIPLANLYAEIKNPRAINICDDLMKKDSAAESLDPYFIKGIYFSNTKQYKQAIEQFEDCIRKDWKFTDAYLEKGIILFEQKNLDEALQTFKLASTISPKNADAFYWQGRCYEVIGRKEEAMDNYIRAYALDRSFTEAKEHIDKLQKEKR
jgi:tetratricopeptide (TPR) repeat protein